MARWNSVADPMATPEGPDINANVRANNNLIWRNVNIVDLLPDAISDATLNVTNPDKENRLITLVIRPQRIRANPSFFAAGQVSVEFDKALLEAWQEGGARGSGFKMEGNRAVITSEDGATFGNLILPYQQGGRLKLIFR